jgi:hypothetical protein
MSAVAAAPLERAQKLAGGAATLAVIAAILIAIGGFADVAAPAARRLLEGEVTLSLRGLLSFIGAVATFLLLAAPAFLLAGALFELSAVLDEYGKGQFFTLRASAGVRKAAEAALWAMAFKIVISPTLYSWITQEGRGFVWRMEPFDLGLIAFAAFVMVMGRVLEAAARIKQENDAIV